MVMLPAAGEAQIASVPLLLETQRLFVAELGNDSLGAVDLAASKVLRTIAGVSEPQGVAYVPFADNVYVANGGDGSVWALHGDDLAPIGRIELAYLPFSHGGLSYWPWLNFRIGLQYTKCDKFDGATTNIDGMGRNAKDNNTFFV